MRTSARAFALLGLITLGLSPGFALAQSVRINEVVAQTSLPDSDAFPPDWIEFFNPTPDSIQLGGWFLTDSASNITRWRFPAVRIPATGFLRVFCTGKDLRDPNGELHTNFQLSRDGEYIALTRPDGEIEDQIAPFFPSLPANYSFGRRQNFTASEPFAMGSEVRYLVPVDDSIHAAWKAPDFDDASWTPATGGLGFDFKGEPTLLDLVDTDLRNEMHGLNASVYVRAEFHVDNPESIDIARLRVRHKDGFVAYINGIEAASKNAPESVEFNSRATTVQDERDLFAGEEFVIPSHRFVFRQGRNVIAMQGLNDSAGSRDFLLLFGIETIEIADDAPHVLEFFEAPSPDGPNGTGFPRIAGAVEADQESRLVHEPLQVELTSPDGGEIRYTLNGGFPDRDSELYTGPITIETSTRIRATAIVPGFAKSPTASFSFPMMDPSTSGFDSDLPLFVIETFGVDIVDEPKIPAFMHVVNVDATHPRSSLTIDPQFAGRIGIERRGSSTIHRTKASYALETRDSFDEDRAVELLDMPEDSDWVLYGPMDFDRALIRNALMYRLSNRIGLHAIRTQFVEIFVNLDASRIDRSNDYYGIYVFMEKISRGPHRVDVEPIARTATEEPEITGGYLLKRDRPGPGDVGLPGNIQHVYPREEDIPPHQVEWLRSYLSAASSSFGRGTYPEFFDVDSAVDFHILREFAKSQDHFIVSTYFSKPRGRPIHLGPVWDFDRTFGSLGADPDIQDPIGWSGLRLSNWWSGFFNQEEFVTQYKQRWQELRNGRELDLDNMFAFIDSLAEEIAEAQVRNFQRWQILDPNGGWERELQIIKDYMSARFDWMDTQLYDPPIPRPAPGLVALPMEIDLMNSADIGEVYYTLDGSDPKGPENEISPSAQLFDSSVVIVEPTRIRARVLLRPGVWTNETDVLYYDRAPTLAITEIMYNPTGGDDFEFVELHNHGETPVRLHGIQWGTARQSMTVSEGPEFLKPGEYTVILKRRVSFSSRYDTSKITISGEYPQALVNTGDRITLRGSLGEPILSFLFRDRWHPSTDGAGHSLVLIDPATRAEDYGLEESWRASFFANGSPGEEDPTDFPTGGQLPGDSNQDGRFNLSDALHLITALFRPADATFPCQEGRPTDVRHLQLYDSNADFRIDTSDVIYNLTYLFGNGAPPTPGLVCIELRDCPDVCAGK